MTEPKPKRGHGELRDYILAHRDLTARQIAEMLGAHISTVGSTITRMRKQGLLPPASNTSLMVRNVEESRKRQAESFEYLKSLDLRDEDQRLKAFMALAAEAPDATRLNALKFIDDTLRSKGSSMGPPPPTNEDQQLERAVLVLLALGRDLAQRAFDKAYPILEPVCDSPVPA